MTSPDRTDRSPINRKEVYRFHLETIMPRKGWPKGWPNIEVPSVGKWWQEPKSILPNRSKRFRVRPQNARLLEISGLPQTGKSSSEEATIKRLRRIDPNWDIHDWPEFIYSAGPDGGLAIFPPGLAPDIDDDDIVILPFEKFDGDDWYWALYLQVLKYQYLSSRMRSFQLEAMGNSRSHHCAIAYRGPVDALIWYYALAAHQSENSPFAIPTEFRGHLSGHIPFLTHFDVMIRHLDAVVLIGIDQQLAQARRAAAGKNSPGWITDSPIYGDLLSWNGFFIDQVWPRLHEQFGTGLLVLNGEESLEVNIRKMTEYFGEVLLEKE